MAESKIPYNAKDYGVYASSETTYYVELPKAFNCGLLMISDQYGTTTPSLYMLKITNNTSEPYKYLVSGNDVITSMSYSASDNILTLIMNATWLRVRVIV